MADLDLLALVLFFERPRATALVSLGISVWASLLGIAVFSLSLSMLLYFWVIEKIPVTQASLSIYLLPVFGILLSTLVVHERVTARLVFGGLLVLAGTFLVTVYEERRRTRNAGPEEEWRR